MIKIITICATGLALTGCISATKATLGAEDNCKRIIDGELIMASPMPPSGKITIHKECDSRISSSAAPTTAPAQ